MSAELAAEALAWIEGDPDPATRAELEALSGDELAERFAAPLSFGTAGLRGPVRGGPSGMNVAVVTRTTWALGEWLKAKCLGGGTVVVGRDARRGSEAFFAAATEVLTAQGFAVVALPEPGPTPWVSFATKALGAVAGVQITASHNPPADNGYKVYLDGGAQLVSPADAEIEGLIAAAPAAKDVDRSPVPADPRATEVVAAYLDRVSSLRPAPGVPLRIALTPMHGVGGKVAVEALRRSGFDDVHVVEQQFAPDGEFPTVTFPNPEEPGASDLLLALAERVDADLAIALDPDADRCALGARFPGVWRMLTGDESGSLLGAHLLDAPLDGAPSDPLVATTIVSSELLGAIAESRGARYARTLTGFKNLVRAGDGLVFAYEEALGLCVDPSTVRDKDGISAAVVVAGYAAALKAQGSGLPDALDTLYRRHGVYLSSQYALRVDDVARIAAIMAALRADPPVEVANTAVGCEDLLTARPATDALVFRGDGVRVTVRPSGTEPKAKFYLEVIEPVTVDSDTSGAEARARQRLTAVTETVRKWAAFG
ncbi:phosphomannomutase [Tsukamurella tyrosinosolvens]|uniref:Phosphomannomutase n=1 Tax=Tsukamurella tyrosinosolvens TaxID=57704 RepID=A0A1H4ZCD7_TSUTY|nr:phospho-sugar mutase [Tsukamurella tyrosinosolvens]KXO95690.1 phosphomannomutase [Tsukamurella tyrosinosolvens]SED27144.1 phosphomannomutase [Tsukamurella tyrosinosolvens]